MESTRLSVSRPVLPEFFPRVGTAPSATRLLALSLAVLVWLGGLSPCRAQEKREPRYWKETPDQATVLAATFLGGKGNEWLVSGGFLPDGTIVVVGNVQGPTFDLAVPAKVIGTDLPKPEEPKPVPVLDGKGAQKTDKSGTPQWEKPSWRHAGTTGFIVRLSGDLKTVWSVHRLPWTSAALTSAAVDKDGAIYIAGRATDGIAKLGGDVQEMEVRRRGARGEDAACKHAFVARLSSDASRVEWLRHSKGPSDAPQVALTTDGKIRFRAQDVRTLDSSGKVSQTVVVPGGVKKTSSVSPVDARIVTGGRAPLAHRPRAWRCPTLNIHKPDGCVKYQLYDWGGPRCRTRQLTPRVRLGRAPCGARQGGEHSPLRLVRRREQRHDPRADRRADPRHAQGTRHQRRRCRGVELCLPGQDRTEGVPSHWLDDLAGVQRGQQTEQHLDRLPWLGR